MESSMSSMHTSHYEDARIEEYLEKKIAINKINFEQLVNKSKEYETNWDARSCHIHLVASASHLKSVYSSTLQSKS